MQAISLGHTKTAPPWLQENHDVRASLGVGKKADEDLVSLASQAGAGAAEASQGQQPVENRLQCAEQQERQVQPPKVRGGLNSRARGPCTACEVINLASVGGLPAQ